MTPKENQNPGAKTVPESIGKTDSAWFVVGMMSLGALVGFMSGLSSAPVTLPLMGAVFSLIGGSVTALLGKHADLPTRRLIGKSLSAFCSVCVIFLILGIWAKEYRWFTPRDSDAIGLSPVVLKTNDKTTLELVKGLCANQQYETLADMIRRQQ